VVGVGALLLPGLAGATAGSAALLAWGYHLLLGCLLVVTFAALAAAAPVGSAADLAAYVLGPPWQPAVAMLYLVGISVGQAAVAVAGGHYLWLLLGGRGSASAAAAAVLLLAAALAASGRRVGPRARAALLAGIVLILAVAVAAVPLGSAGARLGGQLGDAGVGPAARAAFLLLFAFVGWESVLRLSREARAPRLLPALLGGVALVALLYGAGALAAALGGARLPLFPSGRDDALARLIALLAAPVCVALCSRNLVTAGTLASELAGTGVLPAALRSPQRALLLVGAAAAAALGLLAAGRVSVAGLLAVPNAMALVIYGLSAAAGLVLLRGGRRLVAAAALAGCAVLLPVAGAALLWPLAAASLALAAHRTRQARASDQHGREM
jgi:amino acid transporter